MEQNFKKDRNNKNSLGRDAVTRASGGKRERERRRNISSVICSLFCYYTAVHRGVTSSEPSSVALCIISLATNLTFTYGILYLYAAMFIGELALATDAMVICCFSAQSQLRKSRNSTVRCITYSKTRKKSFLRK